MGLDIATNGIDAMAAADLQSDIDIQVAVDFTLSALTLDEKDLGQALFKSERVYGGPTESATVWIRAPKLELSEALKTARGLATGKKAILQYVNLYCDTLAIQQDQTIDGSSLNAKSEVTKNWNGSFIINIYARRITTPNSKKPASIKFAYGDDSSVMWLTPVFPPNLELTFTAPSGANGKVKPVVDAGKYGMAFYFEQNIQTTQLDAPVDEMKNINYLALIKPDGTLQNQGYAEDELPRLLQMQTLIAQAHVNSNRPLAIELLNYVIAGTACSASIEMHYQAVAARNSLLLPPNLAAASSINIYASKQVLKAHFQSTNSEFQTATCLNMLAKSNDAIETYKFITSIRQREYDNAVDAVKKAKANFDKNNAEIASKGKDFEKGVEKYKKDQEDAARKAIIKGIIGMVVAVAATVATAGAAAPAIAGAGAQVVGSVEKAASLIQKIKAIFDQLKKLKEKIEPVLEKLRELVEMSKNLMDMIQKLKTAGGNSGDAVTLRPGQQSGEVSEVGISEWQRFNLAVMDMQDQLKDYEIDGKRAYFMSLRLLVIAGECYIKTQVNLVQKTDDLVIIQVQSRMEARDQQRLSSMAYVAVADKTVLGLLRRAMFDRVLAIRGYVYQDFQTYKLAYNYHTLSTVSILKLSPVKPVNDYLQDAATLQGAVVAYGSRALIQSRKFTLRSLCGFEDSAALGAALSKDGTVSFTVDPQDSIWRGFGRIRMSSARCYLIGAKVGGDSNTAASVKLQLDTDGRFFDRDCFQKVPESGLSGTLMPLRSFVGDSRTLLFEYDVTSNAIICDGLWGQERDYTKYTPLTTWKVSIVGHQGPDVANGGLIVDFSSVTALEMELNCDVIWAGW
ncbi:hypothetical protein GQ44DRAFT_724647 [Phaeosphaeriaceae sp. PMI808]|nr:hypothetical protein GQ44DRAFT_724647 [Phaeosphaeriaceae sp. PMI808]